MYDILCSTTWTSLYVMAARRRQWTPLSLAGEPDFNKTRGPHKYINFYIIFVNILLNPINLISPSSEAHLALFGGEKKSPEQEFRRPHHNHLISINAKIDRCDDGSVLIARRISGNQRAKIRWGLLTP